MASTTVPQSNSRNRVARRRADRLRLERRVRPSSAPGDRPNATSVARRSLGRYVDSYGRLREVIAEAGAGGSVLVLDHDAVTLADRRLVAHLAPDEPLQNAVVASRCYLEQARVGRCRCRSLSEQDLIDVPFAEGDWDERMAAGEIGHWPHPASAPIDRLGRRYRLERLSTGMSIPELRWCRSDFSEPARACEPVSVREAVGALQAYAPICDTTCDAVRRGRSDESVSTAMLRAELVRVRESPIVLNRGLREAVSRAIEGGALSLSEIAMRCGRVKRDAAGNASGETSWLARRLGMMPEGGRDQPTPWVHSEVLALIARDGLGVSPREVESN
ncbi:MAG TPA: hypothetical protein VH081_05945 [Solirubrobacteraceae bacterium]|jgi:hypothetical protein|nr:hypothetical protein [Solirubrobacteraceae bacterium]